MTNPVITDYLGRPDLDKIEEARRAAAFPSKQPNRLKMAQKPRLQTKLSPITKERLDRLLPRKHGGRQARVIEAAMSIDNAQEILNLLYDEAHPTEPAPERGHVDKIFVSPTTELLAHARRFKVPSQLLLRAGAVKLATRLLEAAERGEDLDMVALGRKVEEKAVKEGKG